MSRSSEGEGGEEEQGDGEQGGEREDMEGSGYGGGYPREWGEEEGNKEEEKGKEGKEGKEDPDTTWKQVAMIKMIDWLDECRSDFKSEIARDRTVAEIAFCKFLTEEKQAAIECLKDLEYKIEKKRRRVEVMTAARKKYDEDLTKETLLS